MKPGSRAIGIAESFTGSESTICAAVTTTEGVVDGFAFSRCTVGGLDATDGINECWRALDRADIQYVLINGVAWAWYNILDVDALTAVIDVPILLLTFEPSDGLDGPLAREFSGSALTTRRERYDRLPPRTELKSGIFVRQLGPSRIDPETVIEKFRRSGQRPEPIRVARLAARAADAQFGSTPERP